MESLMRHLRLPVLVCVLTVLGAATAGAYTRTPPRGEPTVACDRIVLHGRTGAEDGFRILLGAVSVPSARQLALFANTDTRTQQMEQRRWLRIAKRTEDGTARMAKALGFEPITQQAADGPENDPAFPNRYFTKYTRESIYLDALRDGANAEGDRAEEQFTAYAVSLTLFAVVLTWIGTDGFERRTVS